jgi:hypothetical protein
MALQAPLMQAPATCSKESPRSVNRKVDSALLLKTPAESRAIHNRYYVSTHMNKMIVALIASLFVSGAAFATEASGPVVASGASAAKATPHKKHKSKKAAKAASAASAASAAQ